MLNDFQKFIDDNHLADKSDRILLAVSGGIDSLVMANLFIRTGFRIGIAHCNFTLRGREFIQSGLELKSMQKEKEFL
jgi:tRNA(Ile)-lysidine synthase